MGAGNLKQVSPTECRCPFDKTSFDLQRKTRGAKCNGRGSPGNGHTSSTNQTGVAMHRNLFQVFKLFHHLAPLLIAGSTTGGGGSAPSGLTVSICENCMTFSPLNMIP